MASHGTLHVTIKDLRGISNQHGPIEGNFHIELNCDQTRKQNTKTVHGMCPKWDETFTFQLTKNDMFLNFAAYEEVKGKPASFATASIPIQKIIDKPEDHIMIDMLNSGRNSGELTVQLRVDK